MVKLIERKLATALVMSKLRFFALAIIIISLIQLGVDFGFIPNLMTGFWSFLSIIVGMAAFLIADRHAWDRSSEEITSASRTQGRKKVTSAKVVKKNAKR